MKAIWINKHGGPEMMKLITKGQLPSIQPNQVKQIQEY